ncbi:Peptidyl-prolyl cis-trans isomerase [Gammaproteobacteria bacterium]
MVSDDVERVRDGKWVSLTYSMSDIQGRVLEQSDIPVHYLHGGDQEIIGGLDAAMLHKAAGDILEMNVSPEQGFGPHDPALTFTDEIDNVPPQFRHVGAEVEMQNEAGESRLFRVTHMENGRLTIDGNHPLAGKALRVRVRIEAVRDARPGDVEGLYPLSGRA